MAIEQVPIMYAREKNLKTSKDILAAVKQAFEAAVQQLNQKRANLVAKFNGDEKKEQISIADRIEGVSARKNILDAVTATLYRAQITSTVADAGIPVTDNQLDELRYFKVEAIARLRATDIPQPATGLAACLQCFFTEKPTAHKGHVADGELAATVKLTTYYIGALVHLVSTMYPYKGELNEGVILSYPMHLVRMDVQGDKETFKLINRCFKQEQAILREYLAAENHAEAQSHLVGDEALMTLADKQGYFREVLPAQQQYFSMRVQ